LSAPPSSSIQSWGYWQVLSSVLMKAAVRTQDSKGTLRRFRRDLSGAERLGGPPWHVPEREELVLGRV